MNPEIEKRVTPRPIREEQAWQEIGQTDFAPGVRMFLVAGFLLLLVGMPLLQFLLPDDAYARLSGTAPEETASITGLQIEAVVAEVSDPPDRDGIYKDFLMQLHLTNVTGAVSIEPNEWVLIVTAMRQRMIRPVAGVRAGTKISVVVQDWSDVEKTYSEINGSTLPDDRFLTMPTYYGQDIKIEGMSGLPTGRDFIDVWAGHGRDLPPACRVNVCTGMCRAWQSSQSLLPRLLAVNRHLARRIKLYENALDDGAVLALSLRSPVQALLTSIGVGNEKAYVGRDGWLFFAPGVRSITGPGFLDPDQLQRRARSGDGFSTPPQPDPRKAILHFRDQLAERGIELVVMPTPVKPTIHPEFLAGRLGGMSQPVRNRSFDAFLSGLQDAGIRVYDPAPLLMQRKSTGPQYLATDTHWRPDAVAAVAQDLAAAIDDLPQVDLPPWRRTSASFTQRGDIARMLDLPAWQQRISAETTTVMEVHAANGPGGSLDNTADVLLLGDSFSNIYSFEGMGWGAHAGLAEQLAFALNRPVDRLSRNDAGAHASRQRLVDALKRDPTRLDGKRLVIWQFAERELAIGDWKLLNLPAAVPGGGHTTDQLEPSTVVANGADARAAFAAFAKAAEEENRTVVAGRDDWLFLRSELRHLAHGPFWGEYAASQDADPLHALVDLDARLDELGIQLIVAPAPPRAVIYADKLFDAVPTDEHGIPQRLDLDLQSFYTALRNKGVTLLDVTDALLEARRDDATEGTVSCEQDTHWSPRGQQLVAEAVANRIGNPAWLQEVEKAAFTVHGAQPLTYIGDLVPNLSGHPETTSQAMIRRVTEDPAGNFPLTFNDDSPVLLLADSHGLVFSIGGGKHCTGAGFGEQLSAELGIVIDCMARRGSGAQVRRDLARRFIRKPADAARKRVLIYTFAARTFTESDQWKTVPLKR